MPYLSVPVLGTAGRTINCGRSLHLVANEKVRHQLADAIEFVGEDAEWYAVVFYGDGSGVMRGRTGKTPAPPQDVLDRMVDLAVMLNREMHYGGHWVVFWADDRMFALYRDRDGIGLVSQKFDDPWPRVRNWPVTDLAERCEAAMAQGDIMLGDHGARRGEAGSRFN